MTNVNRKRRHFRDDFKRDVLAAIESGKANIHNIKDEIGKPIKALLIERWKDQFRTEGIGMSYTPVQMNMVNQPKQNLAPVNFSTDDLLREIGRLEIENRQLRNIAYKSQYKSTSSTSSAAKTSQVNQAQSSI